MTRFQFQLKSSVCFSLSSKHNWLPPALFHYEKEPLREGKYSELWIPILLPPSHQLLEFLCESFSFFSLHTDASTTTTKNIQRVSDYILCLVHTMQKKDNEINREEFCKLIFEETEAELDWFITLCWNIAVFASTVEDYAHSCFFWYCVFLFCTLAPPSNEILETKRHALTLTVATFLRIDHTDEKEVMEELTLPKCVGLIATC